MLLLVCSRFVLYNNIYFDLSANRVKRLCQHLWDFVIQRSGFLNLSDHKALYQAALDRWGQEAQFDQAVEECAEMIAAIKHFRRGKVTQQAVVDELADVLLMVGQMIYMLGEDAVNAAVEAKIRKLSALMEDQA
jgi:NTP pyrophosphatase (non-canonical NTP hydrolase)